VSSEPAPGPEGLGRDPAVTQRFYVELRDIARRLFGSERRDHTLQPTALVNEACVRIMTSSPLPDVPHAERVALAARVLKQVLIDHERGRRAAKRDGGRLRIELDPELSEAPDTLADFELVRQALERLRALHERQAEVVTLRVFGGLSVEDTATALGLSRRTVEADWTVARAWLRRELARATPD
jgi:RNA polymerase sigma factor (TIGR02999 family)